MGETIGDAMGDNDRDSTSDPDRDSGRVSGCGPVAGPGLQARTVGIILGTERFDACVAFYRDVLALPVWFEKPGLVCLHFGDGYLMIETGGMARDERKPNSENPTMLRFNVEDVDATAAMLHARGVDVEVKRFDWGVIGAFTDPDGNACELKDADDPFFRRPS